MDLMAMSAASEAVVAAAAARVVRVEGGGRAQSGIVWGAGQIVTAEETLAAEERVAVVLPCGDRVEAEIAGRDPSTDVALLRVETGAAEAWEPAPLPRAGAVALAVGRGSGGPLAGFGVVAEAGGAWTSAAGGRIDARLRLGMALGFRLEGGAAVDAAGRLLGMAVADPRRRALVIPVETIDRAVAVLAEKGYVGRGWLGLALHPLRGAEGLVVVEVSEGGPGAAAGLLVGDVVTTWDGEAVGSMRGLAQRLGPDAVGRSVRLGLLRGGAATEVAVTVGERQAGGRRRRPRR
jgi:S1-C subfamily serine protease